MLNPFNTNVLMAGRSNYNSVYCFDLVLFQNQKTCKITLMKILWQMRYTAHVYNKSYLHIYIHLFNIYPSFINDLASIHYHFYIININFTIHVLRLINAKIMSKSC